MLDAFLDRDRTPLVYVRCKGQLHDTSTFHWLSQHMRNRYGPLHIVMNVKSPIFEVRFPGNEEGRKKAELFYQEHHLHAFQGHVLQLTYKPALLPSTTGDISSSIRSEVCTPSPKTRHTSSMSTPHNGQRHYHSEPLSRATSESIPRAIRTPQSLDHTLPSANSPSSRPSERQKPTNGFTIEDWKRKDASPPHNGTIRPLLPRPSSAVASLRSSEPLRSQTPPQTQIVWAATGQLTPVNGHERPGTSGFSPTLRSKTEDMWNACKICELHASEYNPIIRCPLCGKCYHHDCHRPWVKRTQNPARWQCNSCARSLASQYSHLNGNESFSSPNKRQKVHHERSVSIDTNLDHAANLDSHLLAAQRTAASKIAALFSSAARLNFKAYGHRVPADRHAEITRPAMMVSSSRDNPKERLQSVSGEFGRTQHETKGISPSSRRLPSSNSSIESLTPQNIRSATAYGPHDFANGGRSLEGNMRTLGRSIKGTPQAESSSEYPDVGLAGSLTEQRSHLGLPSPKDSHTDSPDNALKPVQIDLNGKPLSTVNEKISLDDQRIQLSSEISGSGGVINESRPKASRLTPRDNASPDNIQLSPAHSGNEVDETSLMETTEHNGTSTDIVEPAGDPVTYRDAATRALQHAPPEGWTAYAITSWVRDAYPQFKSAQEFNKLQHHFSAVLNSTNCFSFEISGVRGEIRLWTLAESPAKSSKAISKKTKVKPTAAAELELTPTRMTRQQRQSAGTSVCVAEDGTIPPAMDRYYTSNRKDGYTVQAVSTTPRLPTWDSLTRVDQCQGAGTVFRVGDVCWIRTVKSGEFAVIKELRISQQDEVLALVFWYFDYATFEQSTPGVLAKRRKKWPRGCSRVQTTWADICDIATLERRARKKDRLYDGNLIIAVDTFKGTANIVEKDGQTLSWATVRPPPRNYQSHHSLLSSSITNNASDLNKSASKIPKPPAMRIRDLGLASTSITTNNIVNGVPMMTSVGMQTDPAEEEKWTQGWHPRVYSASSEDDKRETAIPVLPEDSKEAKDLRKTFMNMLGISEHMERTTINGQVAWQDAEDDSKLVYCS